MEQFDPKMAERVWKRVQNRENAAMPEPMRQDPGVPVRTVRELAALYQSLSRVLPGKSGERAWQLWQETQGNGACLLGMCALAGRTADREPVRAGKEPPRRWLEKCCHKERLLMSEYEKRAADPEWGTVYAALGEASRRRCMTVLEIIGSLQP